MPYCGSELVCWRLLHRNSPKSASAAIRKDLEAARVTAEEVEHYWFAFVLYSVKRLSDGEKLIIKLNGGSGENRFTLCQILRAAKLDIIDFFKELPHLLSMLG